jgi:hypothetical protein
MFGASQRSPGSYNFGSDLSDSPEITGSQLIVKLAELRFKRFKVWAAPQL